MINNHLKLIGAKHFIDMPTGTIYQRFWCDNESELNTIIEQFKTNQLEINWNDIEFYGDNNSSCLYDETEADHMNWYNANVVGDAYPKLTLYLIIPESKIPQDIKEDVLVTRDNFVKLFNNIIKQTNTNDWAKLCLEEMSFENDYINFCLEV